MRGWTHNCSGLNASTRLNESWGACCSLYVLDTQRCTLVPIGTSTAATLWLVCLQIYTVAHMSQLYLWVVYNLVFQLRRACNIIIVANATNCLSLKTNSMSHHSSYIFVLSIHPNYTYPKALVRIWTKDAIGWKGMQENVRACSLWAQWWKFTGSMGKLHDNIHLTGLPNHIVVARKWNLQNSWCCWFYLL